MPNIVGVLVLQDTVLKRQPVDSGQLPTNEKQAVPAGTYFVLQSYAEPSNNHYRVNLEDLQIKGFSSNWYIFAQHVQIVKRSFSPIKSIGDVVAAQSKQDGVTVPASGNLQKLVFNVDTVIKRKPVDAAVLNEQSKQLIPAGTELIIVTNNPDANNNVRLPIQDSHLKFTLKALEIKGFTQDWYAFIKHVALQRVG
ncbi:MAG TPA: hypothetical protein V6C85_32800 [Allocoleopsis sp.]